MALNPLYRRSKHQAKVEMDKKMDPAQKFEEEMRHHVRSLREIEGKGFSEVEKVYQDAVIFITGGTGFLGKQLVEKLLRACPGIKKIYLLSRSKKRQTFVQRLDKLLEGPVFDELRARMPDFEKRIVPIEGDVSALKLGISDENWQMLTQEVNFIFHVAATVRFDEPIKFAVQTNVRGTREALVLAQESENLRCMVHVSTAYSHCNRTNIKEMFYDCPVPPNTMIDLVESVDEKKLDAITPELIKDWPNTYTFSKALAEEVIRTMGQDLPVCIVRPAIVIASYQEPSPGWIDMSNVYGPSGMYLAAAVGVSRVTWVEPSTCLDMVPVDYVNNLTIVAAWDTVQRYTEGEKSIKIFTVSRKRNPDTWQKLSEKCDVVREELMSPKAVWYAKSPGVNNIYLYWFYVFFLHWIPAAIIDPCLSLVGSKYRLLPLHRKAHKLSMVQSFFAFQTWVHHDENTLKLHERLPKTDQTIFRFNIPEIDLLAFAKVWGLGIRKYIVKDGLVGTEWGVRKQFWLHKLHVLTCFLYAWGVFKFLVLLSGFVVYCCDVFISYLPDYCNRN